MELGILDQFAKSINYVGSCQVQLDKKQRNAFQKVYVSSAPE